MPQRTKPIILAGLMRTLDDLEAGKFEIPRASKVSKTKVRATLKRRIKELEAQGIKPTGVYAERDWNNRQGKT